MIEAVRTYETLVYYNDAIRCYVPEGYHFHIRRLNNLKLHKTNLPAPENHAIKAHGVWR